jgi:glyoxylase-like metal-dependent hydrolase (beta-lactamase superfamily II)
MDPQVTATVRMYRLHELGDCFLLTFTAGPATTRMLIDCGSFRNGGPSVARLDAIVRSIGDELDGAPLDVVVGTHQHNDHVSGFVHCEETFRAIGVEQVWLPWLDDPDDALARTIGTAHRNLLMRLADARDALAARRGAGPVAARTLEVMDDVLGFFGSKAAGAPPTLPAEAVRVLKSLGRRTPRYLRPGCSIDLPGLPPDIVRVHVLGPPRARDMLYRKDPRSGESYVHALMSAGAMAARFLEAVGPDGRPARAAEHYPFNEQYKRTSPARGTRALQKIARRYRQDDEAWRAIDEAWLQQGEQLALYLDSFTNNSSLVLAIELVESGKVLLFVGDAQVGNWRSWKDVAWERDGVTTADLLARTVLYKVGHHASHNATLVELFEAMSSGDLVALIPVHKGDPNIARPNGWRMPATNLFRRLVEKTHHRVLQMDDDNPPDCNPLSSPAKAAWKGVGITPRVNDLWIGLDILG